MRLSFQFQRSLMQPKVGLSDPGHALLDAQCHYLKESRTGTADATLLTPTSTKDQLQVKVNKIHRACRDVYVKPLRSICTLSSACLIVKGVLFHLTGSMICLLSKHWQTSAEFGVIQGWKLITNQLLEACGMLSSYLSGSRSPAYSWICY